jgi:hypothetical protein
LQDLVAVESEATNVMTNQEVAVAKQDFYAQAGLLKGHRSMSVKLDAIR